jgi:hypothetical protein
MSTRNISWGKGGQCIGGASTSWNPQGLSKPVMRFLYLT